MRWMEKDTKVQSMTMRKGTVLLEAPKYICICYIPHITVQLAPAMVLLSILNKLHEAMIPPPVSARGCHSMKLAIIRPPTWTRHKQ